MNLINFKSNRPEGYYTFTDKQLSKICKEVEQFLQKQNFLLLRTLSATRIRALAQIITEFGEDTYFEIGLWDTLEQTNQRLFGNPLPFSKPENEEHSDFPFDEYKLAHLLWNVFLIFKEQDYFSPQHADLLPLAEKLSYFLEAKFDKLKGESSVKKFLITPNKLGFQVKRKLVWLGKHSYLFRHLCDYYLYLNDASNLEFNETIPYWDDFLCQECTLWSGMGALDFLTEVIGLTDAQKLQVSNWYERHVAYYKILEVNKDEIKAENLIINKVYLISDPQDNVSNSPFEKGMIIYGGLVPFEEKWYWSGNQRELRSKDSEQEIARNFKIKSPSINYRYDKEMLVMAKKRTLENYEYYKNYYKKDYAEFKTGKEYAKVNFERMLDEQKQRLSPTAYEEQLLKFKEARITAESIQSKSILESEQGICSFYNPAIGEEIIIGYHKIKAALQKNGENLSIDDIEIIQHFFQDSTISLEFVKFLIREFGTASIAVAFYLKKRPKYWVDYLLRKMNGQSFRNRYPMLSVMDTE
ncbi:MAG: DUF3843 family protein [Saprospiraceae bacterium]